jgi:response regulator RpfG family c-di-GMP phosphodiesterase
LLTLPASSSQIPAAHSKEVTETGIFTETKALFASERGPISSQNAGRHIRRVIEYSRMIAEEIGLGEDRAKVIRLASTMHDIGKLLIPAEIKDSSVLEPHMYSFMRYLFRA